MRQVVKAHLECHFRDAPSSFAKDVRGTLEAELPYKPMRGVAGQRMDLPVELHPAHAQVVRNGLCVIIRVGDVLLDLLFEFLQESLVQ